MGKRIYLPALAASLISQAVWAETPYNAINESIGDSIVDAGDVLVLAIPATGYFAAWLHDDFEGAKQLTLSGLVTQGIVEVTKDTVGRYRPNSDIAGGSYKSFPSGHSAGAFSGAAFLQSRYGSAWGIPAYLGATFVAASRVHGRRHYTDDVLAGAGIAFLINQYFVSPYSNEGISGGIYPNEDGGFTMGVTIPTNALQYDQNAKRGNGELRRPNRHRFELNIGFNMTDSLGEAGAKDLMPNSQLVDDHQPFSTVVYEYQLDKQNSLELEFSPNETRRFGTLAAPLEVGGKQYQAGDDLYVAFKQWGLGGSYYHHYPINDRLQLSAGAGLYAYWVELETDYLTGGLYANEGDVQFMPSISGKASYRLIGDLSAILMARYQTLTGNQVRMIETGLNYELNPDWDFSLKYGYSKAEWDSTRATYHTDSVILGFANRF
ncbi:phosphatase PAP2 family protein [Vibrio sp.]|uniref:phosphatase PAP2 family protein n=1 Tax=Vibrio sp. TaxID=678 RepID=UPI003D14A6D2